MRKNITSPKDSKAKPEHRKSEQPSSTKNMRESETSRTSLQQRSRLISIHHDQASEDDVSDTKDKEEEDRLTSQRDSNKFKL